MLDVGRWILDAGWLMLLVDWMDGWMMLLVSVAQLAKHTVANK